jgi:hypothetical protein
LSPSSADIPPIWHQRRDARTTRLRRPRNARSSVARPRPPHPPPNVRDDRETPLFRAGDWVCSIAVSTESKSEKFFEDGLDRTANQCARLCKATPTRPAQSAPATLPALRGIKRASPPVNPSPVERGPRRAKLALEVAFARAANRCGWGDRAIASSSAKARQSVNSAISLVAYAPRDDCILPRCRSDIAPTALVDQAPPVPKTARKSPPGNQECR